MALIPFSIVTVFAGSADAAEEGSVAVVLEGDLVPESLVKQALAKNLNLSGVLFVCRPCEGAELRFDYYSAEGMVAPGPNPVFAALWVLRESNRLSANGPVTIESKGRLMQAYFEGNTMRLSHIHTCAPVLSAQACTLAQGQIFI